MIVIIKILSCFIAIIFSQIMFNVMKKKWQKLPPSPIALPIIGHFHLLGPLIHHSFHKLSSKYGPLIYLKLGSVPCVVASTPELAKQLLKTHELTFSSRKYTYFAIDYLTYGYSFSFSHYGPYWKFIKKISTSELLGNRVLNRFLPIRANELDTFLRNLYTKSRNGETVNVTQELLKLSNNIISLMMLSMRSSGTDNEAEIARSVVRRVTQVFGEFNVSDFIWFCKNLDLQGFRKRVYSIHKDYDGLLEKLITKREQIRNQVIIEKYEAKDFLDILLDVMEEDQNSEIKFTRNHIKALILDMFTAATDTQAITLEWAVAELINHPIILRKARDEIERVVGNDRIVEESDISNLVYIQAILKETLRLHPPVPIVSRKATEDCEINGYRIPENSLLFVNVWSIGRDPKSWKNPLKFEPERFLECSSYENIDLKGQHFELLPFGSGRRSCPGIPLAMKILPVALAAMIQCFDFQVNHPVLDMNERPGLAAPRIHDLVCVPVLRTPHLFHP